MISVLILSRLSATESKNERSVIGLPATSSESTVDDAYRDFIGNTGVDTFFHE